MNEVNASDARAPRSKTKRGALVLHGFTATAREVEPLAEALRARGFEVECPTLPGHGTSPRDLQATTWHDWYAGAEAALGALARRADRLAACGLSMGALLALRLAAERSDVRAVASLAAPLWLPRPVALGVRVLAPIVPFVPKAPPDLSDPVERAAHVGYRKFPLRAVASLLDLMGEVRRRAADVRAPALVVHSRRDHTAPPASARWLAERLPGARLVWLDRSFHVVTRDVERDVVEREVGDFLEGVLG